LGDAWRQKAIVAKIETPLAVKNLPELIIHAAGKQPFGVMIARGDLAVEIGYQVAPLYRRQGYASEATKAMMDWTLSQPGMQTVTAGCAPDNIASKRVLEKIGMDLIEAREKVLVWKLSRSKSFS
jgi:predicted GNAT family acetyltransferase